MVKVSKNEVQVSQSIALTKEELSLQIKLSLLRLMKSTVLKSLKGFLWLLLLLLIRTDEGHEITYVKI
jgi:hypothetical protein